MIRKTSFVVLAFGLVATLASTGAFAETYRVGPTRAQKEPTTAFLSTLKPGDVVELDGDHTYAAFSLRASGTASAPITLRGVRVNGKRPLIQSSGGFTVHIERAEHTIVEGLEISGGDICLRHYGAYTLFRDSLIHHCKNGVLGTDYDSGSLTIEYVEIHSCGSGDQHHQIYMTTDSNAYPGSVFRLQHSYIHDGAGGNNVKTRSERNEIYANWIEGAYYHELELIGPDADVYDPHGDVLPREDSDVVGNVLRTASASAWSTIRVGGDGTGGTSGRYRFVNNTILVPGSMSGAIFRHFMKLESIEMHNNAFVIVGAGDVRMALQQGLDADWDERTEDSYVWSTGAKVIAGSNNWVSSGFTEIPDSWSGTIVGNDPGFEDLAQHDLRPAASSPLVDSGVLQTASAPGFAFPNGLPLPTHQPPVAQVQAVGSAPERVLSGVVDIGAYEFASGAPAPTLPPPADAGVPASSADAGVPASSADAGVPASSADAGVPSPTDDPPPSTPSPGPSAVATDAGTTDAGVPSAGDTTEASPTDDAGVATPRPSQSSALDAKEGDVLTGGCTIASSSATSTWPLLFLLVLGALAQLRRGSRRRGIAR